MNSISILTQSEFCREIYAIFILMIAVYTKPLLHRVVLQLSKKYGPVTLFSFGKFALIFSIIFGNWFSNQTFSSIFHVKLLFPMNMFLLGFFICPHQCRSHTGPIRTVFLNNYEVVMEAMVKRKADFAGRPASVTCECTCVFNIYQATNITSLTLNRVIFKKGKKWREFQKEM